jgi:hypothetical protein
MSQYREPRESEGCVYKVILGIIVVALLAVDIRWLSLVANPLDVLLVNLGILLVGLFPGVAISVAKGWRGWQ